VSAFNYFDRALLGLMAPLIRRDILISDTTYGWISGFAFVLFYALLGIPIAALADRVSRRNVIAVGFTLWTLMTMLTGFVSSAMQLAVTRFLVGAGEACASAPSNAMINDMFRKETRGRALSLFFAVSSSISSIVFVPMAGLVSADHGWRTVFIGSGLIGLVVAGLFALTVTEPTRTAAPAVGSTRPGGKRAFFDFGFIGLPFILLVCSSALNGAHLNAAGAWSSIFLNRVHGLEVREIAVTLGPFRGVLSGFGILLGGYLVDRLTRVDPSWRLWMPALACFLVTPASFLFLLGEQRWVWMTGFGLDSLLLLMHVAPVYALAMDIAGPQRKALALSILMLSSSLVGSGLGPLMVGFMNDRMLADLGPEAIRYSLLIAGFFPALSAVMLVGSGYLIERGRRLAE
jgi:MFS family permease